MKVAGMLFAEEMIQAFLAHRKCRTRRPVKLPEDCDPALCWILDHGQDKWDLVYYLPKETVRIPIHPPYAKGTYIYARETFACRYGEAGPPWDRFETEDWIYRADGAQSGRWYPSIHMPREAARLWFRVTEVHPERLQDINAVSAMGEGMTDPNDPRAQFAAVWDKIYADRGYGWKANSYVWAYLLEPLDGCPKGLEHRG